jgi:hypothetical protein
MATMYENLWGNCVGGVEYRVDICMTFHKRTFDFFYTIAQFSIAQL